MQESLHDLSGAVTQTDSQPIKVLCVSEYFLPGFRAGGPIRTLANIARLLDGPVMFSFLTRNHDLGCRVQYDDIELDAWNPYSHGRIFYAPEASFGVPALIKALSAADYDVIYLNSFFSYRSSISIVVRNWAKSLGKPLLIAPRGEFSPGALTLKGPKKRLFLAVARATGLYRAVWWHASTEREREDILRQFPDAEPRILVAEDPVSIETNKGLTKAAAKVPGRAKLIFVSRISPKKNLDGLIDILTAVRGHVSLSIYGPIEDAEYWERCQTMIANLPANITATYLGELRPEEVSGAFAAGDLFAFPTHGENFGHVIFEALAAGTPVLISDQTPWRADGTNAVTAIPLDDSEAWRANIDLSTQLTDAEQQERRKQTLRYAERHAASREVTRDNLRMFQKVANRMEKGEYHV